MKKYGCGWLIAAILVGWTGFAGVCAQEIMPSVGQDGKEVAVGQPALVKKLADEAPIVLGANRTERYFPLLEGKRIGLVSNKTGVMEVLHDEAAGCVHVLDSLLHAGFDVVRIFCPEHGFRGEAEAGAQVDNGYDEATGIRIVSLYGKHKKPTPADLDSIDIVIFDLQDVGVRFYTYISTLHYVMEACAENGIEAVVLDRPNPHTAYIDGPVLDTVCCRSFVGMHPVPVVYGMTIGEYARMILGEGWLHTDSICRLTVVPLQHYYRGKKYDFPVSPSPNLPCMKAIHAYPSLCLFEGTPVSVGRGTWYPFMCYGFAGCRIGDYEFTPKSMPGYSLHPPFENQKCRGFWMEDSVWNTAPRCLDLQPLTEMYRVYPDKTKFFNNFFDKLAGTDKLRLQIQQGKSEEQIRASWKKDLEAFEEIRERYLMY